MLITQGKTEYRFPTQNAQEAEQIIQSWLSANNFQQMQEDNTTFYRGGDAMLGYRFFEYSVNDSQVVLYAYLGSVKKPRALAEGLAGAMAIIPYKNALEPLLASLSEVSTQSQQSFDAAPAPAPATPSVTTQPQPQPQPQPQNTYGNFKQVADNKNGTYAEISFWISIVMLLASFAGIAIGAIIVIFNYYLAVQGLKSNKKGKAIAAIVMSSIAIFVIIIQLLIKLIK